VLLEIDFLLKICARFLAYFTYGVNLTPDSLSFLKLISDCSLVDPLLLEQGWANSGPRAKCGPPQRFEWPAEAFRKYVQITINVSAEANLTKTCFISIRRYGPLLYAALSKWLPGQINCPSLF